MNGAKLVITTVLTTFVVIAFAGVFAASLLPSGALAHGGWQSGGHFRGHGRHSQQGFGARCERLSADHTRMAGAMASAYLDLSDEQEQALAPVLSVLNDWRSDSQALCSSVAAAENHNVNDALVAMEAFLSRSATAVAALQPTYASFEASLEESQRAKIANALARHHGPAAALAERPEG